MSARMKSLAKTPAGHLPVSFTRKLSGTRNQVLPKAMATATSVEPIPVAKAPRAPPVQVCESEPTSTAPG